MKGFAFLALSYFFLAAKGAADPLLPVMVRPIEIRQLTPTFRTMGEVRTPRSVALSTEFAGDVTGTADVGTVVRKGGVVVQFDAQELLLEKRELLVALSRAEIVRAQSVREHARLSAAAIAVSRLQLEQAKDAAELAEQDKMLLDMRLARLDHQLAKTQLRAPFDCVVVEQTKRPGERANLGEIVIRVIGEGSQELRVFLPLRYVSAVEVGTSALAIWQDREIRARVKAVVRLADSASQSFEIILDGAGLETAFIGTLLPVEIPSARPSARLAVPRDAIQYRELKSYVFIVRDGRAKKVQVETTVTTREWIAVEGELHAGDAVIVRGGELLRGDEHVQVLPNVSLAREHISSIGPQSDSLRWLQQLH